jgi:myo-inositol-1(or 4)-monophosphatase
MCAIKKNTPFHRELQVAIEAAKSSGCYLRENRNKARISRTSSNPKDYTTVQDIQSEKRIVNIIKSHFPNDSFLLEESSPQTDTHNNGRYWIVDPLDGTRNYLNGLPCFSVSVAFVCENEPKVGVVYLPNCENELFFAEKNQGAFLNGYILKMLNSTYSLEDSIVAAGFSYLRGKDIVPLIKTFAQVANIAVDLVRYGSAAAELCYVAAGRLGAFFEIGLKPWDVAAASLILKEAGGVISGVNGDALNIYIKNNSIFFLKVLAAKNHRIHKQLLDIVRPLCEL